MIELTLYGHPTSTYEYVKMIVRRNLERAGVEAQINEIHDWEEIVKERIESLPTIRVNGHIDMSLLNGQNVNTFIQEVTQKILKEQNYGSMKKILVPTDFSDVATNALVYAHSMSKVINGVVNLVHVYKPEATYVESVVIIDHELEKIKRKQLDDYVANINQSWVGASGGFIPMDGTFKVGFVIDEVKELCEEDLDDTMVIVGSTGSSGRLKQYFGSVTTKLAKICPSPLLIVPPKATFDNVDDIMYAADDIEKDLKAINKVAELALKLDARVHIVHVHNDEKEYPSEGLMAYMHERYPECEASFKAIEGEHVSTAINDYAVQQTIDIVAVSTEERGFFADIFHKSISRKLAIASDIPLYIVHVKD